MRKKLKIFMELILAMTLIFGSTLCYASDGDVVEANDYNTFGVTRSQQETKHIGLRISNTDIVVYFDLHYAWEEGYTSWFTGAELTEADVPDGHTVIIYGLTYNTDGNSSNITVTIDMEYEKLRCNQNCIYCQASSKESNEAIYDMKEEYLFKAIDLMFQSHFMWMNMVI